MSVSKRPYRQRNGIHSKLRRVRNEAWRERDKRLGNPLGLTLAASCDWLRPRWRVLSGFQPFAPVLITGGHGLRRKKSNASTVIED